MSRGGAGNILAREQERTRAAADLEAHQPHTTESQLRDRISSRREEQLYAHSGRGGAGNYYSPQELSSTGQFSDGTAALGGDNAANGVANSATTRTVGRGGAGNWMFGAGGDSARAAQEEAEEDARRERLRGEIEKGVGASLSEPPKAKLAGTKAVSETGEPV
ncbi:hypothetical protein LTR53_005461 [Teratosphaeriaceae sp. CCFEE 6253]|nr:hypothetical protein LTR53_005461 [Teratosphaeriaceae sp. CCFEE 6253]